MKEEDFIKIGISEYGKRRKIMSAISELPNFKNNTKTAFLQNEKEEVWNPCG